jgi:hypothetical protein
VEKFTLRSFVPAIILAASAGTCFSQVGPATFKGCCKDVEGSRLYSNIEFSYTWTPGSPCAITNCEGIVVASAFVAMVNSGACGDSGGVITESVTNVDGVGPLPRQTAAGADLNGFLGFCAYHSTQPEVESPFAYASGSMSSCFSGAGSVETNSFFGFYNWVRTRSGFPTTTGSGIGIEPANALVQFGFAGEFERCTTGTLSFTLDFELLGENFTCTGCSEDPVVVIEPTARAIFSVVVTGSNGPISTGFLGSNGAGTSGIGSLAGSGGSTGSRTISITNPPPGFGISVSSFAIIPGDVNNDGFICFGDRGALGSALGSSVGDPDYNVRADIDFDGDVDSADRSTLLSLLDFLGCPPDFNCDGVLNCDDLSDYIAAYFESPPPEIADYDADGAVTPDDLSDYITDYFNGC